MEPDLISTITSMHIQHITFEALNVYLDRTFTSLGRDYWTRLDHSLCRLVERPGYKLRLDVEFRFSSKRRWTGKPRLIEEYLPKIHERARVRAIEEVGNNKVAYCSDRDR